MFLWFIFTRILRILSWLPLAKWSAIDYDWSFGVGCFLLAMLSLFGGFKRKLVILTVLLFMLLVVYGCRWWQNYSVASFPVNKVQIYGEFKRLSTLHLQALVMPFVDQGFFQVDRDDLSHAVEQLAWVEHVEVQRFWPDRVAMTVTERQAVALWNGETLVNPAGLVFSPDRKSFPNGLPQLIGPKGQAMTELVFLEEANRLLVSIKLRIVKVTLVKGQQWSVTLNNGIKLILGHEQLHTRLKRFIAAYSQLFAGKAARVVHVNLCYSHSMAVQWKK